MRRLAWVMAIVRSQRKEELGIAMTVVVPHTIGQLAVAVVDAAADDEEQASRLSEHRMHCSSLEDIHHHHQRRHFVASRNLRCKLAAVGVPAAGTATLSASIAHHSCFDRTHSRARERDTVAVELEFARHTLAPGFERVELVDMGSAL